MSLLSMFKRATLRHPPMEAQEYSTSAVHLRTDQWDWLRAEALAIAKAEGGRVSQSRAMRRILDSYINDGRRK